MVWTLLLALMLCPIANSQSFSKQNRSTENKNTTNQTVRSGFYLEIKRSYVRAYPGWQKKTIGLLKSKGFTAFSGNPKNRNVSADLVNVDSIERTSRPINLISAVYAGPYNTAAEAEHTIPALLSALKPLIDAEKKNDELHNRFLFLVGVVRVL